MALMTLPTASAPRASYTPARFGQSASALVADPKHANTHVIHDIPLFADGKKKTVNAVIEIPAGTRAKYEARLDTGAIEHEIKKGKPRYVEYLGYPTMYGFLPQTKGPDDADPLDALILADNHARGAKLPGKVIGALKMIDDAEQDYKYVVVPDSSHFKHVNSLDDLPKGIMTILKTWFTHYKLNEKIQITGTLTAEEAHRHIEQAHQRWQAGRNGARLSAKG